MIYKLHLTRDELEFLSIAVEERQKIIRYILDNDQRINAETLPFDPDPLTDAEKDKIKKAQDSSVVIAEKLHLLTSYAILSQESVNVRNRAAHQKKLYLDYAVNGIREFEPDFDDFELEIPDPE